VSDTNRVFGLDTVMWTYAGHRVQHGPKKYRRVHDASASSTVLKDVSVSVPNTPEERSGYASATKL
jgi:hypothetical protein